MSACLLAPVLLPLALAASAVGAQPVLHSVGLRPPGTGVPVAAPAHSPAHSPAPATQPRERRTRAEGRRRGAWIGFVAGAASTLAMGAYIAVADPCDGDCWVNPAGPLAVAGAGFTAATTVVGAIIGHNAPGRRPRRAQASAGPAPGGAALAVRVGF